MEKLKVYRKRARHLFYAFIISLSVVFLACLPLYPYFRVPVHVNLAYFMLFFVFAVGIVSLPPAYIIKRRLFPVNVEVDPHWSYTATRRYFWIFVLCLLPFFFSLLVFVAIARLDSLFLGYLLSLCGLILVRPKEEDIR